MGDVGRCGEMWGDVGRWVVIKKAEAADAHLGGGFDRGLRGGEQQRVELVHVARAELLTRHDGAHLVGVRVRVRVRVGVCGQG